MGGLMEPTAGTVEVGSQRVRGPMPREIAFVFQENALFPWSTVIENVKLGMLFQGVRKAEREKRAKLSLDAVGLTDFADYYPGQLSGGMRQRAALARALSLETGILLMDEPFGALDEQTRMVLGEDLSVLLSRTEKTIVFVTHSLGEPAPAPSRRSSRSRSRIRASPTSSPPRSSPASATGSIRCCTTKSARRFRNRPRASGRRRKM
jgi:NitT/TauT family transport system ATP-binding protein